MQCGRPVPADVLYGGTRAGGTRKTGREGVQSTRRQRAGRPVTPGSGMVTTEGRRSAAGSRAKHTRVAPKLDRGAKASRAPPARRAKHSAAASGTTSHPRVGSGHDRGATVRGRLPGQAHRGRAEARPRCEGQSRAARSGVRPRAKRRQHRGRLAGSGSQPARRASSAARSPARKADTQGRAGQGRTIPPSRVGASAGMRKESTQSPPVWMSAASS